jgi:hypothetical protein
MQQVFPRACKAAGIDRFRLLCASGHHVANGRPAQIVNLQGGSLVGVTSRVAPK